MAEMTVADAARKLGVSEQRTREMLRGGELRGRQLGRSWLVDANSVQRRCAEHVGAGRVWSEYTVKAIVCALSDGEEIDAKSAMRLRRTDIDTLWRKLAQGVTITTYRTRHADALRDHLALTGESAIGQLGEQLVGQARVLHGYLHGISLEDAVDEAGLVEDGEGNLAIHQLRTGEAAWLGDRYARRALIAVDCARTGTRRVSSAGIRALEEMRQVWLAKST